MELNLLVRGQSNAILLMEAGGWAGAGALTAEVERLLGFDGVGDRVNLVYERFDEDSGTAFGGTALIGDWLTPSGDGWAVAGRGAALLEAARSLPAAQRDDPTAVLWLHSEYDSANRDLTVEQWMSAVRFDAAQLRDALGQDAATVPYLFVSAMPYYGTEEGHQAIRLGMERLAADPAFNATIAARMLDIDADGDADGSYGGGHIDAADAMQTVLRAARGVAETFASYAKPGSPVALAGGNIADDGPMAVSATPVGADSLSIDLRHDGATRLAPLDPDAARGVGWEVIGPGGRVEGVAARIEDADTLVVTFSGALPQGGVLHYGHGYGRLAGADGTGRGNAVYDDAGLPAWVPAEGLVPGANPVAPAGVGASGGMAPAAAPAAGLRRDGGSGENELRGGAGADTLTDGAGVDDLQGLGGDDVLRGGRDHDGLTGGAGSDVFVFARGDGPDWVVDYQPGVDRLRLEGIAPASVVQAVETRFGMVGLELSFGGGDEIFLQGISAPLSLSDVVFA